MPDLPYRVNVRRQGMTGRRISARLSPKPTASISLPAHLLSFGSKVSMWLTPPHMNRKMTDFALGGKCGPSRASWISPASAQSAAHRDAEEAAAGLVEEPAPGDPAAGDREAAAHVGSISRK